MKKQLSLLSLLVVFSLTNFAQQKVALHSNGTTTIFSSTTPLIDAYTAAAAGDTLYVSGGGYDLPNTVDKALVIIGAGFYPDYTIATLPSIIVNTLTIGANADGLYIEGFELQSINKSIATNADNVTITRCLIHGNLDTGAASGTLNPSTNLSVIQCIIEGAIILDGYDNSIIVNSIIQNRFHQSGNNVIQNNIFLFSSPSYMPIESSNSNTFENNIFHQNYTNITSGTGNIFRNNIFNNANPYLGIGFNDYNNYKGIDLSTVYVSQSGNTFSFADDYHLQSAAQTLYVDEEDNSPVGIYGGILPYKDGALPMNPHISAKTIAPSTDGNGLLNISITVNAQQQ